MPLLEDDALVEERHPVDDDWDVDTLFTTAFGKGEGNKRVQQWTDLLDGDQTNVYFASEVDST